MRHPTEGTLRRLVDEPAGVADADREHVAGCPECRSGLAAAEEDAAATGTALHVELTTDSGRDTATDTATATNTATATAIDMATDAAWRRLSSALARGEGRPQARVAGAAPRRKAALRSPVVVALGAVVLLAGASAAAAADWLQIFRTEQITPVAITEADLVELPDLSAYGEVEVTEEPDVRQVADAAAAEAATGLSAPRVSELPRGVAGGPTYQVGGAVNAVFTFSAEQAAEAAAAAGETLPPPPAGLDGSRFQLTAGPGLAEVWSEARGVPALIVARAVAPTAYSSGVPFETARTYLLSLPGLPDDVASQLRSFSGDGTTLPLPIPAEEVTSSTADVGGVPATVLTARDGTMAAVVWVNGGNITAVAGSLSADEVLAVARGLR